jgi:hypothetical protein
VYNIQPLKQLVCRRYGEQAERRMGSRDEVVVLRLKESWPTIRHTRTTCVWLWDKGLLVVLGTGAGAPKSKAKWQQTLTNGRYKLVS